VLVVVAVGVDAVAQHDLAVAVVVPEVLPPQPLVVERVLVAVGVGDEDEPQLCGPQQPAGGSVAVVVGVDHVVEEAPVDLDADPLPGVLGGQVERRRAPAVADPAGVLRDLEGDDLSPLVGGAEHHLLDQVPVVAGELVDLVADAAGLVPRAPHRVAGLRLGGSRLAGGLALGVALEPQVDAGALRDAVAVRGAGHGVHLQGVAVGGGLRGHHVDALLGQLRRLLGRDRRRVGVERRHRLGLLLGLGRLLRRCR
jgi:hypothetical protein